MSAISTSPEILQFESLQPFCDILTFSTTRNGGCSSGAYGSFNLSYFSGDAPENVTQNRMKLCDLLQINSRQLFVPCQTHGTDIAVLDEPFLQLDTEQQQAQLYGKDALITDCRQIAIAVTTADCVPIILYAADKRVGAAIHAGWRGTCDKIVQRTIDRMIDRYSCNPQLIHAVIAPSISQESFEVGEDVYEAFLQNGFDMTAIARKNPGSGKYHIDLWEANRMVLVEAGVPGSQIEVAGICTRQNGSRFFSARAEGINSGRMLTGIVLR